MLRWIAAGGVALAALGLAGCTSSPSEHGTTAVTSHPALPEPTSATGKTATSAAKSTVVPSPQKLPDHIANDVSKRKNVQVTGCQAIDGGWMVKGTARNPGTAEQTFHLTVFFSTTSATTLAAVQTDVKVAPGKTATWKVDKKFTGDKQMNCTLVGVA